MALSRKEIQTSVLKSTRQNATQIGDLVNDFINFTLNQINDPGWAFKKDFNHSWSFLRQKTSFQTVNGTTDYILGREIDQIAILRQTQSPIKLIQVPEDKFFQWIPNPTATGNPRWYRLWSTEGVATRLATADTIDVVSDSTSDSGDSTLAVSVSGYVNGIWTTETYALNGTSSVSGSITFDAREIIVSKQKNTTGTITVSENSGATELTTLGPKERTARFKVVSLYPQPGSAITMELEFFTTIPILENDSDTPIFNKRWHHVVRMGTMAKVYQYLNKETDFAMMQGLYASSVRAMVDADKIQPDLVEYLAPRAHITPLGRLRRSEEAIF